VYVNQTVYVDRNVTVNVTAPGPGPANGTNCNSSPDDLVHVPVVNAWWTSTSPTAYDRIPAIVAASATGVSAFTLLVTFLLQLKDGVSEAATGIPGIGVDFGGVGGGLGGVDMGLFQIFDAA